ncbi:MAG: aspartate kinase [Ktedonobacteraceae bacterium]
MKAHVQILKFGGTSVGNGERIRRVAQIIAHTFNNPAEAFPVMVVSAMSKVTDQLLRIAGYAYAGEQEAYASELEALKQKHLDAAEKAVHNPESRHALQKELHSAFILLEQDIENIVTAAHTESDHCHPECNEGSQPTLSLPFATAAVAAWGERLSVLLVAAAAVDIGLPAVPVREEVIITEHPTMGEALPAGMAEGLLAGMAEASFDTTIPVRDTHFVYSSGGARVNHEAISTVPLSEETRANAQAIISPLVAQGIVPITAGFIGRTILGAVTTLGRNGSDYSASVIGAALDCVEVTIYTDVDGVLTADPRLVMNTRLLANLSYAEAARLSWFGAKVLHPRTLIPIAHLNIPVRVRNTFRPMTRGTVVGPQGKEGKQPSGAAAITVRRHLALVTVESTDLFGAPENAGQVFALAARAGAAPVAICSSSGHHLSFVVEEQAAASVVALLQHDMGSWRVRSRAGLAACACIGSGFTVDPMSPARAITALARERIPVITQGVSELGITLIVEDVDSERALRSLHRDLIAPVIPLVRHAAPAQEKKRESS